MIFLHNIPDVCLHRIPDVSRKSMLSWFYFAPWHLPGESPVQTITGWMWLQSASRCQRQSWHVNFAEPFNRLYTHEKGWIRVFKPLQYVDTSANLLQYITRHIKVRSRRSKVNTLRIVRNGGPWANDIFGDMYWMCYYCSRRVRVCRLTVLNSDIAAYFDHARQRYWSTLVRVMACCLTAPSHYPNQCWL